MWCGLCTVECEELLRGFLMPGPFSLKAPGPPNLGPEWSIWIMVVAVLFLIAVAMFYIYAS